MAVVVGTPFVLHPEMKLSSPFAHDHLPISLSLPLLLLLLLLVLCTCYFAVVCGRGMGGRFIAVFILQPKEVPDNLVWELVKLPSPHVARPLIDQGLLLWRFMLAGCWTARACFSSWNVNGFAVEPACVFFNFIIILFFSSPVFPHDKETWKKRASFR